MIELLSIAFASSATIYPALRDSAGRWWDWSADTWRTDVADVVNPGPTSVTEITIAGQSKSLYSASINLALLNPSLTELLVFVDWRRRVGSSRDLEVDTSISSAADAPINVIAGRSSPFITVEISPCYDPEAGSGQGRAYFGVSVLADGEPLDLSAIEDDSTCEIVVTQQGSDTADVTATADAPDAAGRFDCHVDDPTLIDNRNYHAVATITLGNGNTITGGTWFPVAG